MRKTILLAVCILFPLAFSFAGVSVIGELAREKTLIPGEKTEGIILIKNNEKEAFEARVYKTDYFFFADGRDSYGEPGSVARSNAGWISLKPSQLSIPAGETGSVYYTVCVPQDPSLTGSYWSMIMVESVPSSKLKSIKEEPDRIKMGVQTVVRYGIQIVTDIGDTGKRSVNILDKKLISQGKNKILQLDIENTGERRLRPAVWAEVYNTEGKYIGRFESGRKRIYPGCSVRYKIDLTDLPRGKYKGLAVIDNGDANVFGAQYDFAID